MYGFKEVQTNDHALAAYLRRMGAIDTWQRISNANMWRDNTGRCVAVCMYESGASCTYKTFILEGESI
jgi:hypothetical protein